MKIGKYYVDVNDDCGENEGGYYCVICTDEDYEHEIDTHCVLAEEIAKNPSVRYWLKKYLEV